MQIGGPPGNYKITAETGDLTATKNSAQPGCDEELTAPRRATGEMSKEDRAKADAKVASIRAAFSEGAALSNAGKHDEAIAKFNEVLKDVPKCPECHIGIAASHAAKKDYAAAEAAYKAAIELDPNSLDAYSGLATIYKIRRSSRGAAAAPKPEALDGRRRVGGAE